MTRLLKGASTKNYFYNGLDMLSDGSSKFLHGAGIDQPLQIDNGPLSASYLTDHLGSTSQLANALNGQAKARYDYASYGKLEDDASNPILSNPFTYTGREDDNTGLMYYRARYYDPELEIFISEDPLGDAQRYVSGNPLALIDPLGLYRRGAGLTNEMANAVDRALDYLMGCEANSRVKSAQAGETPRDIALLIKNSKNIVIGPADFDPLFNFNQLYTGQNAGLTFPDDPFSSTAKIVLKNYLFKSTPQGLGNTLYHEGLHAKDILNKVTGSNSNPRHQQIKDLESDLSGLGK